MDKQQLPKEQRNEKKKKISKDLYRQLLHAIEAKPLQRELSKQMAMHLNMPLTN